MIRIKTQKITINYQAINKIKDLTLSPELLLLMKNRAQIIINQAKPKITYSSPQLRESSSFYKKYPALPHMRDRLAIQKEKKTNFKYDGEKLQSWNVPISLNKVPNNKKIVYPYVMFAGKMRNKNINYSNSLAQPFPVEIAYRKNLKFFIWETENFLRRKITDEFND